MQTSVSPKNTRRLLVIALISLLSWKVFYPIVTQPLQAKRERIAGERRGLESLQNQLGLYTRYLQQIRESGRQCLQPDAMAATIRYQEWLRTLCIQAGISDPNISIKEPLPEDHLGSKVQVTIRSTATLAAVGDLIDMLSTAAIAHRIVKLDMKDWDSASNMIGVAIDLDAISLQNNPTFDPALLTQSVSSRGLGNFFDQHQSFSRYMPPQPVAVDVASDESIAVSTQAAQPDLLNACVLVGIVQRNGDARALFRDSFQNKDMVLEQNQELTVGELTIRVATIASDHIVIMKGDSAIQVTLGQSLRQGIDAASDAAIF